MPDAPLPTDPAFWEDTDAARAEYTCPPLTDAALARVEAELGVTLPADYVAMARHHNGGVPVRACHRAGPTSWADDHVALTGLFGIGDERPSSLLGETGHAFWVDVWGYPEIGVYFADCPSAGHDLIALDYRACGPEGEPSVVHVDQDADFAITPLAPTFGAFVRGLQPDGAFD